MHASDSKMGFCSLTFAFIWATLHTISLNYGPYPTTKKRLIFTTFFQNFGEILPCSSCGENFKKNLMAIQFHPIIDLISRTAFAKCVWRLHNEVNRQLGKDVFVSFEDMNIFYEQLRASDCDENSCSLTKFQPRCIIRFVPYKETDKVTISIDEKCVQNEGSTLCIRPMTTKEKSI